MAVILACVHACECGGQGTIKALSRGVCAIPAYSAGRPDRRCCNRGRMIQLRERSLTNLIGNGVATVVVARWEGALDAGRMNRLLNGEVVEDLPGEVRPQPVVVA